MILADSSAWIEFLRGTGSDVENRMRELLSGGAVVTTGAVSMEVMAGARDPDHAWQLKRLLATAELLPTRDPEDFEMAAAILGATRAQGSVVRAKLDCLIAAVAIRHGVPILHRDADFEVIADVSPLQLS